MAVNVQKLRADFSRLEKRRDTHLESRNFEELKIVLNQLDELKEQLALHDPESEFATQMKIQKAKQIFKGR